MKSHRNWGFALLTVMAVAVFSLAPEIAAAADHVSLASLGQHLGMSATGLGLAFIGLGNITTKNLRALQSRKAGLVKDWRAVVDKAAGENRDLTEDESKKVDEYKAQVETINKSIEQEQALIAAETSSSLILPANARITGGEPAAAADPRHGFTALGEFARVVRSASSRNAVIDERLAIGAAAPSTFGNEGSGADGGFLVPPEFAREIFQFSLDEDSLLPMTDSYDVAGNSMVFPKDETTPWGTDGVRMYWQAEAATALASKPKFGNTTLRLHKLMGLVPMTDELLEDAGALDTYLTRKFGTSLRWKTGEAILYGTGAGQPQGALSAAAPGPSIVVAKDAGQATGTLTALNLANMIARLLPGSYSRAVWLINNDVLPSLFTLTLGNYPIYIAPGGIKDSPYGMLLGRPVIVSQHAATFSSQGDIQLHDLSYYRVIQKTGGPKMATSMHLYFDADATAFRMTFRMDGQPTIAAAVAPARGTKTLSPFIQLAAR